MIRNFAIDLMLRMALHPNKKIDVMDFLFHEIRIASMEQIRSFPYAPFIQMLIDARVPNPLYKDTKHGNWTLLLEGVEKEKAPKRAYRKKGKAP